MRRLAEIWHSRRRETRFLLGLFLFVLALALGAFYLIQRTQVESPQDLTNRLLLFVLWYLDISLILILLFILFRNLARLAIDRRSGVLGSRFRTKLVLTYVGLTFVPVIFIFLIATNLLQRSIDRWFSAPVEDVLQAGFSVTEQLRGLVEQRLERQAQQVAITLRGDPDGTHLAEIHALVGSDLIALYRGQELIQALTDARRIPRSLPPLQWEDMEPAGHRVERWRGGLLIRAWCPVDGGGTIVVGDMLPRQLLLELESTTAAYATFQEMKLARGTVTATTIWVFLAITLLLLFATVWVGLFLSRRFTEPLLAVAAATQRVAEGNQLEEVTIHATDEVAVLVDSFNAMVRRVSATEHEIRASNQELATLLATVPTGVLMLSPDCLRFRPNPAAARLLGEVAWSGIWRDTEELNRSGLDNLYHNLRDSRSTISGTQLDLDVDGTTRHLDVTRKELPFGGEVVAIDDLTQLVQAQRQAAWSEVARRIAHEIKNPLTPIRLAAERIQRHAQKLDGGMREVVIGGTEAIVAHVSGLKALLDSFSRYARMPTVDPLPSSVVRLLHEVTSLYYELRGDLDVRLELPVGEITALVDPVLLRQALVNLLDNAVDAIDGPGEVVLSASVSGSDLVLTVADTGGGLPTDNTEELLQPFYSTKGRGSGMGLALVHRIVTDHGGTLKIRNRRPHGVHVSLRFPGAVLTANQGPEKTAANP